MYRNCIDKSAVDISYNYINPKNNKETEYYPIRHNIHTVRNRSSRQILRYTPSTIAAHGDRSSTCNNSLRSKPPLLFAHISPTRRRRPAPWSCHNRQRKERKKNSRPDTQDSERWIDQHTSPASCHTTRRNRHQQPSPRGQKKKKKRA